MKRLGDIRLVSIHKFKFIVNLIADIGVCDIALCELTFQLSPLDGFQMAFHCLTNKHAGGDLPLLYQFFGLFVQRPGNVDTNLLSFCATVDTWVILLQATVASLILRIFN
jgi:hypothetical protein